MGNMIFHNHLSLVITLAILFVGFASPLHVTVSPNRFTPIIHDVLNLTCIADGTSYWAKDIVVMEISKRDQKPIAVLKKQELTMGPGSQSNMKAIGQLVADASQSYLTVLITKPSLEESGEYSCKAFYLDDEYELKEDKMYFNLSTNDMDVTAVVTHLIGKVSDLEKTVLEQNNQLQEHQHQVSDLKKIVLEQNKQLQEHRHQSNITINKLEMSVVKMQEKVEMYVADVKETMETVKMSNGSMLHLNKLFERLLDHVAKQDFSLHSDGEKFDKAISKLEKAVEEIKDKGSYQIAFANGYDPKDTLKAGDIILFSDQIANVGNAYDMTTGKFTAPRDGIYVFFLTILTKHNSQSLNVSLRVNGVEKVKVYVMEQGGIDQASMSTVLELGAGDKVWPVAGFVNAGFDLYDRHSVFSGFLLNNL